MATLDTLVSMAIGNRRNESRAGSSGSWRVSALSLKSGGSLVHVYHYSHRMAAFVVDDAGELDGSHGVYLSTGWGSVSDQHGMNRILRSINAPFVYRRDYRNGGPRYETIGEAGSVGRLVRDRFGFPVASYTDGEFQPVNGLVAESVA